MKKQSALCSCVYCREVKSAKGIFCHVDRAHLGASHYSSGYNGKYDEISTKADEKRNLLEIEYLKDPKLCKECNSVLSFEKRSNEFCSSSCSAVYSNAKKDFSKIKTGPKARPLNPCVCVICGLQFLSKKIKNVCGKSCARKIRSVEERKSRTDFQNYRADCNFTFNLKDYPDKFDFSLIEQFGWYKAKNRGDNLQGISRDHMISVKWGFENNIDPKIISHPANCMLMRHGMNSSKHSKCSITIEELQKRISEW